MTIFQKLYNFFKGLKYPDWMKPYVQELNDLMLNILKNAGLEYYQLVKSAVIEAAGYTQLSSKEKLNFVFKKLKMA